MDMVGGAQPKVLLSQNEDGTLELDKHLKQSTESKKSININ
jgi:hypothetical protein